MFKYPGAAQDFVVQVILMIGAGIVGIICVGATAWIVEYVKHTFFGRGKQKQEETEAQAQALFTRLMERQERMEAQYLAVFKENVAKIEAMTAAVNTAAQIVQGWNTQAYRMERKLNDVQREVERVEKYVAEALKYIQSNPWNKGRRLD